jgi:DNA primase large subunit
MSVAELRQSPMMAHLLDALDQGKDIGHYGRLTFAMIGHHFLDRDELVDWLKKDPDIDEGEAKALVQQVESRDYNPPSRRTILDWQGRQDFPICPTPDDPDACNPYQELPMPDGVLEDIEAYRERQFDAEEEQEQHRAEG